MHAPTLPRRAGLATACPGSRPQAAPAAARLSLRGARASGFSLVELLIATAIGAGLMVSLAATAHLFTEQVSEASSGDTRLEESVATVAQEVRTAWAVAAPSSSRLQLNDALGHVTEYYVDQGALKVLRPSGASGTVLPGVTSVNFSLTTTPRLREATPQSVVQTCWTSPANTGTASMLTLTNGQAVALGFSVPVGVSSSFDHVTGLHEQATSTTLSRLLLPVSWLDASNKSFCHLHASSGHSTAHPSGQSTFAIELYEARMPGEARPLGTRIGVVNVTAGSLPAASYQWWDTSTNSLANPPSGTAWGWWGNHPTVVLKLNTSPAQAAIDISAMHAVVQPGRAYTLVMTLTGWDELNVQTKPLSAAKLSGFALKTTASGTLTPQAGVMTASLEGQQTITQTTSTASATSVSMSVQMQDGRTLCGSANVAGQLAVGDPWLGAVPGELPTLQLAGS